MTPQVLPASVTIVANRALLFPVAMPPNAIVFATGALNVLQMTRVDLALNEPGIKMTSLGACWWCPQRYTDSPGQQ